MLRTLTGEGNKACIIRHNNKFLFAEIKFSSVKEFYYVQIKRSKIKPGELKQL